MSKFRFLKKGELVPIYEDPYTQTKKEGIAEIVSIDSIDLWDLMAQCHIHFSGDAKDEIYTRQINLKY